MRQEHRNSISDPRQAIRRKVKTEDGLDPGIRRSSHTYGSIRKNIQEARRQVATSKYDSDISQSNSKATCYRNYLSHSRANTEEDSYQSRIDQSKLNSILEALRKKTQNSDAERKLSIPSMKDSMVVRNSEHSERMMLEYHKMMQEGNPKGQQSIRSFVALLSEFNTFLSKLSPLVYIPMFRLGKIRVVPEKKILYHQDQPAASFFIILWGQFKLKGNFSKSVKYCIPGDSLRQNIVLDNIRPSIKPGGVYKINKCLENAQSLTLSGVLEIKKEKYLRICKQLALIGENSKSNLSEKMLLWSYMKKAKFYKGL